MVMCHFHNIVLVSSAFHCIFFQVALGALTHRELLKVISKPKLSESQKTSASTGHTDRLDSNQSSFVPCFGSLLAQDPHANVQITIIAEIAPSCSRSNRRESGRSLLRGLRIYPKKNNQKKARNCPKTHCLTYAMAEYLRDLRQEALLLF